MDWNGISIKRIHKENIKVLELMVRCFLLQRKSGIALDNFDASRRVAQITKIAPLPLGDANNGRIDLVETIDISGPGISRECSNTQTNSANAHGTDIALWIGQQSQSGPAPGAIIRSWHLAVLLWLNTMYDLAVQKFIKRIAPRLVPYFENRHGAVKVAFAIQRRWVLCVQMQEKACAQKQKARY